MTFTCRMLTQKEEMLSMAPLLQQLNPAITEVYLNELLDDMIAHGYRMAGVWNQEECLGVSGIWVTTKLYSGKYLEMDNVVVAASARSQGIGQLLTDFITELARQEGCKTMMLDAWLDNHKAHAFYERQGFVKRGYHFLKSL